MKYKKIKVLFVVMDFYQAGAPRYAYEIDNAIDKTRFEIHFLSLTGLNASVNWKDHYYPLHLQNQTTIHFYKNSLSQRIRNSLSYRLKSESLAINTKLNDFLEGYDVINWIGEYVFNMFAKQVTERIVKKSLIHLMASRVQFFPDEDSNYRFYDRKKHYHFISSFQKNALDRYELKDFENYTQTYFPICFELKKLDGRWSFKGDKSPRKIAVFSRLDRMRPIDTFFYAFHLLLDEEPDLELHVFGAGDPLKEGASRCVKFLHIENRVHFRGHVPDISKTVIEEDIDLLWFQSYYGVPGGYAGFELNLTGVPQIYWELTPDIGGQKPVEGYPCFNDLADFVRHSRLLLSNRDAARAQSEDQITVTESRQNVYAWIGVLEELFEKKSAEMQK